MIEMQHDSSLKDVFEAEINLEDFWKQKAMTFLKIQNNATLPNF